MRPRPLLPLAQCPKVDADGNVGKGKEIMKKPSLMKKIFVVIGCVREFVKFLRLFLLGRWLGCPTGNAHTQYTHWRIFPCTGLVFRMLLKK